MNVDADYDSDVTICSEDFQINDNDDHVNNDKFNDAIANNNSGEILNGTADSDISANLLDGFDLVNFVRGNDVGKRVNAVSQVMNMLKATKEPKIDKIDDKTINLCSQSTFCENIPSQNIVDEFEITQSGLTFCRGVPADGSCRLLNRDGIDCDKRHNADVDKDKVLNNETTIDEKKFDSQQTECYSLYGYPNYSDTHIGPSQTQHMDVNRNHLFSTREIQHCSDQDFQTRESLRISPTIENSEHVLDNNISTFIRESNDTIHTSNNRYFNISSRENETSSNKELGNKFDQKQTFSGSKEKYINGTRVGESVTEVIQANTPDDNEDDIDKMDNHNDGLDSQTEIMPFKVIEELNRVKKYLNRRNGELTDEFTTDSGYKSDSQSHKGSAFKQDTWINQSARCLVAHLSGCPMVPRAKDIVSDISSVLGQVIDRLHVEENYPAFLDVVLDLVASLLRDICEGDGCDQDAILQKNEKIHRLLLFNKSHHIIKYTIEKIIKILERFHTLINSDSLLEINYTKEIENICYIFHVLEILLKRHSIAKEFQSQNSTQTSQEDENFFKRSSITDIWRKKWNQNYKADMQNPVVEERCVESKCCEILNRIIVDAMKCYSLVSYAALQCFNLLKS